MFNFRTSHAIRKYFNIEIFAIYGMLRCVHEQKAQGVRLIGVTNKTQFCDAYQTMRSVMKQFFLTISTVELCLRVIQVPRSRDLVIFVLMDRTDHAVHAHAG